MMERLAGGVCRPLSLSLPHVLSGAALLAALVAQAACGEEDTAAAPVAAATPAGSTEFARLGFALAFQNGCGDCHGALALGGLSFTHLEPDAMRAALVDQPSKTVPSLKLVSPGDPDRSFLVLKLRGSLSTVDCSQVDCGAPMPVGNYPFAEADRLDFEQWVLDGAR